MTQGKNWRWLLSAALLSAALALGADPKTAKERSLVKLLDEGQNALEAQNYKAARDDFSDILTVDPRNQTALDGAMLAYLQLNDFVHAKAELERSLGLFSKMSRPTAINGAAILVHTKNPMRAAKNLMAYMAPQPSVDEDALNALAVALWSTDEQQKKASLFIQAVNTYTADNTKLEATRPGMKRWGTAWLAAGEADKKNAEWVAAEKKTATISRAIGQLKDQLAAAGEGGYGSRATAGIQTQLNAKQAQYDKALEGVDRPPIPTAVPPVSIGAPAGDTTVADAGQPAPAPTPVFTPDADNSKPKPADAPDTSPPPTPAPDEKPAVPARSFHITTYAAAFPVGPDLLVTTAEAVDGATDVQVQTGDGTPFPATVVRSDPDSGLALLRASTAKFAYLSLADQFAGGSISCVSYPSVDLFSPTAARIDGSATAPKASWRVQLSQTPRLGGGPLLAGGRVVGVELASRDSEISDIPAVTLDELRKFLGSDAAQTGGGADAVTATLQVSATRQQ